MNEWSGYRDRSGSHKRENEIGHEETKGNDKNFDDVSYIMLVPFLWTFGSSFPPLRWPTQLCLLHHSLSRDATVRYICAWRTKDNPISDTLEVVDTTYQVGQTNIDGGGFQMVKDDRFANNKDGQQCLTVNVQFQSYSCGYLLLDDVEFWSAYRRKTYGYVNFVKVWSFQTYDHFSVRGASRLGRAESANSKQRLEHIGGRLEKELGWSRPHRQEWGLGVTHLRHCWRVQSAHNRVWSEPSPPSRHRSCRTPPIHPGHDPSIVCQGTWSAYDIKNS